MATFTPSLLEQLPGYFIIKDRDSKFACCTTKAARELIGYPKAEDVIGLSDGDAKCEVALYAEEFRKQDMQIITQEIEMTILDMHPYAKGFGTMLGKKKPCYDHGKNIVGIACNMVEINNKFLSNLYTTISQLDKHFNRKNHTGGFTKRIIDTFDFANLPPKESEVLYYLVHGCSAKEIGHILNRSQRTIETHINHIKIKLGLPKKNDIIMYCIENGFLSMLPKAVFNRFTNLSIEI